MTEGEPQTAPQSPEEPVREPLSPEALSVYLSSKRCDPDAIQEVLIDYLTWTGPPIRHPKSWAWRRVHWRTLDAVRKVALEHEKGKLIPPRQVDILTRLIQRQRLERFATLMKGPRLDQNPRWQLWRQKGV
mgnify:CR=1 FL=1